MNQLAIQKKKRRIINLCLVGLCVLIMAGLVVVDQIQNRKTTVTMTAESAQAQLNELLESLPTSVAKNDMDQFAMVLETYTLLSQKYVRPAYYEVMLTTRNVQDLESSEMLDLIFLNRTYDMAMYFTDLGFNGLFEQAALNSGNTFTSSYQSNSKRFDKQIQTILRKLQNPR